MSHKKKPVSITLAAALVICIITFILGFVISSVAFLDSRLEAANEKNAELSGIISEKDAEIKELKKTIEQKDENNIILGEQIQTHLDTIDSLNAEVSALKNDVDTISEAAINGDLNPGSSFFAAFATLGIYQQLILLLIIFVLIILIISVTCGIIASKSSGASSEEKPRKRRAKQADSENEDSVEKPEGESVSEQADEPASDPSSPEDEHPSMAESDESTEETAVVPEQKKSGNVPAVENAIELLYRNNLEENISRLGGFKFGITNFDDVLSDKSSSKSFGNSESGDFVAFMASEASVKKLYIIPRSMVLSDSTVALRGITDLFNVTNEAGNAVTHGAVKIKEVAAPAIFACGESGWAIESKGEIIALGTKTL